MTDADLVPAETSPWAGYRMRCADGRIPYQACGDCGKSIFPPRVICPGCGSVCLEWASSEGRGTVYSSTAIAQRDAVRCVLLVDLDEGFRVMAGCADDAVDYPIGSPVHGWVEIDEEDEADPRLVFAKEAL